MHFDFKFFEWYFVVVLLCGESNRFDDRKTDHFEGDHEALNEFFILNADLFVLFQSVLFCASLHITIVVI